MTAPPNMTTCANCTRPFASSRSECPHCGFPVPLAAPVNANLIPCPACAQQVSRAACACPGCGQPMRSGRASPAPYIVVGMITASLMGAYYLLLVNMWGHFPLQGQDGGYGPTWIMLCLGLMTLVAWGTAAMRASS